MTITIIFLAAMFLIYCCLIFLFLDTVLEKPRLKKILRIPATLLNVGLASMLTIIPDTSAALSFLLFFILLFLEFIIFYKDSPLILFFCASAFMLHIMSIRAICIAIFSIQTGLPIYNVVHTPFLMIFSMGILFFFLNIMILLVMKIVPVAGIKIIIQHNDLLLLMGIWTAVFNVYLFSNARIYNQMENHPILLENQLIAPLAILIGLYVVMFFAIKTSELLGYKEKSEELAQVVQKEQLYRHSLTSGSLMTYEVNLTRNTIITGLEEYRQEVGASAENYSDVLVAMSRKLVYSEDMRQFIKSASVPYLIMEFDRGKREAVSEYRSLLSDGEYVWVRAVTSLVRDIKSGDIKAFTYIKNIDEEKKRQLELQYKAERDSLTGLYNKGMTSKLIGEHLIYNQPNAKGALFIIDVDYFKTINDQLGHTYGDAVLCELSDKLMGAFRGDDIVGRIGGDEFIAFMKNATSQRVIQLKAEEICKLFRNTYQGENGAAYSVSASIGVVLFPKDGNSFEELYKNADVALYQAKNKGKNTFCFYESDTVFSGYEGNRTEIDNKGHITQKSFKQNRIEYVFKMLYNAHNPVIAVQSVLELVTRHFHFDRGYIFETSEDGKTTSNTFEWCAEGITPEIDHLQNIPIEAVETANSHFYQTGTFVIKSLHELPPFERAVLEPQGIKSMFQFGIFDRDKLLGFVGFDNCKEEVTPSDNDIDEIATICNILTTFFVKQRITERAEKNLSVLSHGNG